MTFLHWVRLLYVNFQAVGASRKLDKELAACRRALEDYKERSA